MVTYIRICRGTPKPVRVDGDVLFHIAETCPRDTTAFRDGKWRPNVVRRGCFAARHRSLARSTATFGSQGAGDAACPPRERYGLHPLLYVANGRLLVPCL